MNRSLPLFLACFLLLPLWSTAQPVPFDDERWTIDAVESRVETYLGRQSLYLKGGVAWIKDADFTNGIIEYDVALPRERGFMGAIWRMQDRQNYEEFYMRPHQSGNPDANQYSPVFNGLAAWQLYHGDGYGAPVAYDFEKWLHVKIVVSGTRGEVYIDSEEPVLVIHELKREVAGGPVGVSVGNFAPGHFSNFSYQAIERPELKSKAKQGDPAPAGTVLSWSVSNAFAEADLASKTLLSDTDKQGLTWTTLPAESTGITNLASVQGLAQGANTVFARITVVTEEEGVKKIQFGYSDRVQVYLNDRRLYSGNNTYRSRDYRYLGTIGLFDTLYLPLQAGENELWLAVSESFGGWGLVGAFDDMDGIRVSP